MSTRAQLSETINQLLPGEQWKRVRQAILEAATYSGQRTDQLRQAIDEANRLQTGKLVEGIVDFTSTTSADVSGFAWVVNFVVRQQASTETITVTAPDADFPRPDIFVGKADGSIEYRAGTIDEEGNVQEPSYDPSSEVLLAAFTRNPDNSNDEEATAAGNTDFVSKSAPGTQITQSNLGAAPLAGSFRDSLYPDANGVFRKIRGDYHGVYSTKSGSSNWSRLLRVDATINNQLDYKVAIDLIGVNSQQGELWVEFTLDSSGDMVSSNLQAWGNFTVARIKLVKIASYIYDLYIQHTETADFFKWRPKFSFGSSDKYTYFHQENLTTLPSGDQYDFTEYGGGGGSSFDPAIEDALNATLADSPGTSNRYVTVNLLNSYAYVQEAPINGNYYARKDGAWVAFTPFVVAGTPSEGQVVTYVSGVPTWATPSGGGGSLWTAGSGFIYREDSVQIGRTTKLSTYSKLAVQSDQSGGTSRKYIEFVNHDATVEHFSINQYGDVLIADRSIIVGGATINLANQGHTFKASGSNGSGNAFRILNAADAVLFELNSSPNAPWNIIQPRINVGSPSVNLALNGSTFKGNGSNGTQSVFNVLNAADNVLLEVNSSISSGGLYVYSPNSRFGGATNDGQQFGVYIKGSSNNFDNRSIFKVFDSSDNVAFNITGAKKIIIPYVLSQTTDPLIAGALWNDSGTVKISAG